MTCGNCKTIPHLGVGLSYRTEIGPQIRANRHRIDFIEIIADHYLDVTAVREQELWDISSEFPVVFHGVGMSVGTAEPLDRSVLTKIATLMRRTNAVCFSEHLSFTKAHGIDIGQLTPLPFCRESIDIVSENVKLIKEYLDAPFLLENITYYFAIPGSEMSEPEFITRVLEEADCGLLLDLTNIHTNGANHGYDPIDFLRQIPLERVQQVHLAGGSPLEGVLIDNHGAPVPEPVWELLQFLLDNGNPKAILLERDENIPPIEELTSELDRVRRMLDASGKRRPEYAESRYDAAHIPA
jgi:uncharacterized protein (UPF0276 family)